MSIDEPEPAPPAEAKVPPAPVAPPPAAPPVTAAYRQVGGIVPPSIGGAYHSTGLVILLTIITLGIWGIFWSYRTGEDLKKYNGEGLGGLVNVVLYVLLTPVLMFTIPYEISNMYAGDRRQSPVSTLWGLWFLLPIIGNIIWYVRVQRALNEFWLSKGSRPA